MTLWGSIKHPNGGIKAMVWGKKQLGIKNLNWIVKI